MPPIFKYREIEKIAKKLGWQHSRTAVSHHIYDGIDQNGNDRSISIPVHNGDMAIGTALALLKRMGIDAKQAREILQKK